jgi:hypothetical protein
MIRRSEAELDAERKRCSAEQACEYGHKRQGVHGDANDGQRAQANEQQGDAQQHSRRRQRCLHHRFCTTLVRTNLDSSWTIRPWLSSMQGLRLRASTRKRKNVDEQPIRIGNHKAPHTEAFIAQPVHHAESGLLRGCVSSIDVFHLC